MTGNTATDTAARVRALRAHYALSQTELATLLDVTRQTVTNWERGYPMSRMARYALVYLDQKLATQTLAHDPSTCAECATREYLTSNGATHVS